MLSSGLHHFLAHPHFGGFGILQLHGVTVRHVGVNLQHRTEEDVDISSLRVLFGNGTIEAVLSSHGEGETVDEEFALLLVAL